MNFRRNWLFRRRRGRCYPFPDREGRWQPPEEADSSAAKSDSSPQDARSRSIQKNGFDKDATGPGGENEDVMINGELIPPQVLAEIFSRIDNIVVLGYVCPLVCRRWNDVLSAPGFWIDCMTHRSMELPPVSLRSAKALNMKKVCLKEPFERNLIENPSGEKKLNGWSVTENGGDGVHIETPPINCTANLDEDIPVAFATSFAWCTMHCIIDLWKAGVEQSFLDEYRPPITVSEYYNCRKDCACIYILEVKLLPNEYQPLDIGHLDRRDLGNGLLNRFDRASFAQDETNDTSLLRVRGMAQWTNAEWQKLEHSFTNYPKGIRYVYFQHAGKDQQFWAGNYGSKMAKASVIVGYGDGQRKTIPSDTSAVNQSSDNAVE